MSLLSALFRRRAASPDPAAVDVVIDGAAAAVLAGMIGGAPRKPRGVRVMYGDGHSGRGLYVAAAGRGSSTSILLVADDGRHVDLEPLVRELEASTDRRKAANPGRRASDRERQGAPAPKASAARVAGIAQAGGAVGTPRTVPEVLRRPAREAQDPAPARARRKDDPDPASDESMLKPGATWRAPAPLRVARPPAGLETEDDGFEPTRLDGPAAES